MLDAGNRGAGRVRLEMAQGQEDIWLTIAPPPSPSCPSQLLASHHVCSGQVWLLGGIQQFSISKHTLSSLPHTPAYTTLDI